MPLEIRRIVGIVHRIKRTANDESRPTLVCVLNIADGSTYSYPLETETDELDWVRGLYPTGYREVADGEPIEPDILQRQLKRKKANKTAIQELEEQLEELLESEEETSSNAQALQALLAEAKQGQVSHVPTEWDGLRAGDLVVTTLGGSGDYLSYAIKRMIGKRFPDTAEIARIKPFDLKANRPDDQKKGQDHQLLVTLANARRELFTNMVESDLSQIEVKLAFRARQEVMRDRIACEQRLLRRLIGQTFMDAEIAPEKTLEDHYNEAKANDLVLQALRIEENKRGRELERLVHRQPVWQKILVNIKGVGPRIAAPLLAGIGDVRRFATKAKLKKYCGVHVLPDGRFPRRRSGELANWNNEIRQALFLLGDQFNRRPGSYWGQQLLEYKRKFQLKHPEVITDPETGKKRYTKSHIHRMATWRTLTKFVEALYRDWRNLHRETPPMDDSAEEMAA